MGYCGYIPFMANAGFLSSAVGLGVVGFREAFWGLGGQRPGLPISGPRGSYDVRLRVQGLGFRVQGLGFRVQGLGFRV